MDGFPKLEDGFEQPTGWEDWFEPLHAETRTAIAAPGMTTHIRCIPSEYPQSRQLTQVAGVSGAHQNSGRL
jgi:hypothetical protein